MACLCHCPDSSRGHGPYSLARAAWPDNKLSLHFFSPLFSMFPTLYSIYLDLFRPPPPPLPPSLFPLLFPSLSFFSSPSLCDSRLSSRSFLSTGPSGLLSSASPYQSSFLTSSSNMVCATESLYNRAHGYCNMIGQLVSGED